MSFWSLHKYFQAYLPHFPLWHYVLMGVLALIATTYFLRSKKNSVYGSIVFGLIVYIILFLLDGMVFARYGVNKPVRFGFDLAAEYNRLFHGSDEQQALVVFNIIIFVPFGFFMAEFLSVIEQTSAKRRIRLVVLIAVLFSLIIECLQSILHVGLFELTDIVMNTIGALIGALFALMGRATLRLFKY